MSPVWQTLRSGGVPLACEAATGTPAAAELAACTRIAIGEVPRGRDAEALAAWLLGWHDHWPSSFAGSFRGDADRVLAWAAYAASDDGRRIKLRRIAIENLATIL